MIKFNFVEWSNFLSTGATPVNMLLNKDKTTLISGDNGAGKTTMLDALCYALFNKPLRSVKLAQLVNSVNKKKLITKVNFDVNGVNYEVHRGQKPTVFQVLVNGEPMNEDAAAKDLQAKLENDILGCDHKTFTQVVIMASTGYNYFMDLTTSDRRNVVEAMLDIEVVGEMSSLMKERVKEVKHRQESNKTNLDTSNDKLNNQKTLTDNLISVSNHQIQTVTELKESLKSTLSGHYEDLDGMRNVGVLYPQAPTQKEKPDVSGEPVLPEAPKPAMKLILPIEPVMAAVILPDEPTRPECTSNLLDRKTALMAAQQSFLSQADKEKTLAQFYTENDSCDRCNQEIQPEFKSTIISNTNNKLTSLGDQYKSTGVELSSVTEAITRAEAIHVEWCKWEIECRESKQQSESRHTQNMNDWRIECAKLTNEHDSSSVDAINDWKIKCASINSEWKASRLAKISNWQNDFDRATNDYNLECSRLKSDYNNGISLLEQKIQDTELNISKADEQIGSLKDKQRIDTQSHHDEQERLNISVTELMSESAKISEEVELCSLGTEMLKDNGLKAKIVEQYLPTINASINEFLEGMGANYSFILDDSFNETIKSRYRDTFSYGSFSNGERSRINIAILMMWKKLAQSKNTVSSNLLFIDEVLDGCLDDDGIHSIMGLFESMTDNNIFVISHRKEITDHFDARIRVGKVGNYSNYDFGE